MTRLPNLELLMYQARLYLDCDEKYIRKAKGKSLNFTIETFPKTWETACAGFDITKDGKTNICSWSLTTEYTTVVHEEITDSYLVFFGDRPCYAVHNPTMEFYEDLKERRLASLSKSKERY